MQDQDETGEQLLELGELRRRVAELEDSTSRLGVINEQLRQEIAECRLVEAEYRQRLDTTTLLHRLSGLIASAADMAEAVQRVCAELAQFLHAPQAVFALLNAERASAEVIADIHPPQSPDALGSVLPVADHPSITHSLETGAPLVVDNAQTDPRLGPVHDLMRRRDVESLLVVPVVADGGVIGTFGFTASESGQFGAPDVDLVQQVASQLGQLLLRRRAEVALERRAGEMAMLYETSLEISAQRDLPTLLEAIVRRAAELVGVRLGGLYLVKESDECVELAVGHHLPEELVGLRLGFGQGLAGRVAETGQPFLVDDYRTWAGRAAEFVEYPFRRALGMPLRVSDRILGVLSLTDDQVAGPFGAEEVRLAGLFADQAAIAIENARLLDLERRAREQTDALRTAAHAIGASLAVDETLRKILDQLRRVVVCDSASALVLGSGDEVDLIVALGLRDKRAMTRDMHRLLERSPILRQMALDLQPVVSHDVRRLDGWIWLPGAEYVRSWMGIPLVSQGRMIGALTVDHSEPGRYRQADLQLAQTLALHASQSIENARLFEETERLKAFNERIVQGIAEGILVEDAQGRITFANPAMEEMLGAPRQGLLGQHWTSFISDRAGTLGDRQPTGCSVARQRRYEAVLVHTDGRRIPVVVSASPILEGGQPAGVLSAVTDISERVRAERAVEERRQYLEAVLDAAPDAIVTMDAQHRIVEWNPGARKLYGYSRAEVIGRDLDDLVTSDESYHEAVAITRRALAGDKVPPTEAVRTRKDGSPVDVIIGGSPIWVAGELAGTVSVYTDITERKQAEAALQRANRGLRMLSECNAVLSRARQEPDLLQQICQIAVGIGGYRLAWVGVPELDEARTVRPVAQAGFEEGYLDQVRLSWADDERGRGPTGTAIRTQEPVITRNLGTDPDHAPWCDELSQCADIPSAAVPLVADGRCLGVLNLYAAEPDAFDAEEVALLCEVADQLAYGLGALRTGAQREWMEEILRRYAERLEMLQRVDRAILEAQSPEAIAQATLARLVRLIPCQQVRVVVFGAEGTPRTLATLACGDAEGKEAEQPPRAAPATAAPDGARPLGIPLMVDGELLGMLRLTPACEDAFSPEHVEIAYEVAAPLAVAIQHARLNEQIRAHAGSLEETVARRTRELQAERDRTQAILESLGEAVLVTDAEGAILYANPATTSLSGFAAEELLGQSWRLLLDGGAGDEAYEQALRSLHAGQPWRSEVGGRRRDDTPYDAAVTATPLFDPHEAERLVGSVWVQRDITPLKEAERLKDRFISNVSHELRTPLSIITLVAGNLDRLYADLDDEKRRRMIRSLREQVGALNDLVGDVLEISRIDSGRVSLERGDLDFVDLVREEVAAQQPLASRKGQRLEITESDSLGVRGNEGQVRQIVRNLLNNAIKFTPSGGEIACTCRHGPGGETWGRGWPGSERLAGGAWAAFRVIDSGIGIGPEDLRHLFQRFYRVEAQGDVPGSGLGLAITRELVELHGGQIAVDSTPGEGSVFAVYLPLREEEG